MKFVLAIFKDQTDAGSWAAYLDGISALWTVTADGELSLALERVVRAGLRPAVVLVSSLLYPEGNREAAAEINRHFPEAELVLMTAAQDPAPLLLQLPPDAVRHLEVKREGCVRDKGYLECVLEKLVVGQPVSIEDRLGRAGNVISFEFRSSRGKDEVLEALEAALPAEDAECEMFRQRAALLADELIENALYGAPISAEGIKLFQKGERRQVLHGERLVFRFGFDGDTLAMEMTDNWGTLAPDQVVEYLARNQAQQDAHEEIGGRGLFLIWRFFDHFHVWVEPGRKTVVGGDLQLARSLDPEAPRGYHITESKKEMNYDQPR